MNGVSEVSEAGILATAAQLGRLASVAHERENKKNNKKRRTETLVRLCYSCDIAI